MNIQRNLMAAAALLVTQIPAMAHHSFAAEFDVNQPVTIHGAVNKMDWVNPHTWIYVDVKNASAQDLVTHIDAHDMTDRVVIYCPPDLCRRLIDLNPKLKVMPESASVERAHRVVEMLHPRVIAFGASDFTLEIVAIAKQAHAEIYVDRMGATDNADGWQSAINAGADGIQTDRPQALVEYLRSKGYR